MGMGGGNKDSGAPTSEINVTPMIDIMLVLLIVFMVATPRSITQMPTSLPQKTEIKKKKDDKSQQLMVAVYEKTSGDLKPKIALNREYISRDDLKNRLKKVIKIRRQTSKTVNVFVDVHPDVEYGDVVEIFNLVRSAKPDKLGLAKLKDEGPVKPSDESSMPSLEGSPG